jgi:hypothetical protein
LKYHLFQNLNLAKPKLLRYRTGDAGEHVVGVPANETHRADYQYQDDGEHDGIFSNVLPLFVLAKIAKILNHRSSGGSGVANNADSGGDCQSQQELTFLPEQELGAPVKTGAGRVVYFLVTHAIVLRTVTNR